MFTVGSAATTNSSQHRRQCSEHCGSISAPAHLVPSPLKLTSARDRCSPAPQTLAVLLAQIRKNNRAVGGGRLGPLTPIFSPETGPCVCTALLEGQSGRCGPGFSDDAAGWAVCGSGRCGPGFSDGAAGRAVCGSGRLSRR